mgnify:CR=1 FL=1
MLSSSELFAHEIEMFVPPMMDEGTEMFHGVEGAVLVETVPSSDTKRVEGNTKAGRMPYELGER